MMCNIVSSKSLSDKLEKFPKKNKVVFLLSMNSCVITTFFNVGRVTKIANIVETNVVPKRRKTGILKLSK